MNTTFSQKDLVSFGNYVMRKIETGSKVPEVNGTYAVTHADTENWKLIEDLKKGSTISPRLLSTPGLEDIVFDLNQMSELTQDLKDLLEEVQNELKDRKVKE